MERESKSFPRSSATLVHSDILVYVPRLHQLDLPHKPSKCDDYQNQLWFLEFSLFQFSAFHELFWTASAVSQELYFNLQFYCDTRTLSLFQYCQLTFTRAKCHFSLLKFYVLMTTENVCEIYLPAGQGWHSRVSSVEKEPGVNVTQWVRLGFGCWPAKQCWREEIQIHITRRSNCCPKLRPREARVRKKPSTAF